MSDGMVDQATVVSQVSVSAVVERDDLYPRIEHDQNKAQEYADNIDSLPPIWVNQHNELIDGKHRLIAHRLRGREQIAAQVVPTRSDEHLLELAISTNAKHGLQLSQADKKKMAIRLYAAGERTPERKRDLAALLAVSLRSVTDWVSDLDQAEREERRRRITDLYLRCYTLEDIGEAVGLSRQQVENELSPISEDLRKLAKVQFAEEEWLAPIYNVWTFAKKTNKTTHFGNTEQRILENLLWAYTDPLDIVVDPFGGGGSTLDVCRKRGRRCWISDRKPQPGLEDKIRTLDVVEELPPLHKRWSDVSLVYLDPPYWAQARGEYSDDAADLGNYEDAGTFNKAMADLVRAFGKKLRVDARVGLIIQPTQWRAPEREFTDHVTEIVRLVGNKTLVLENRVSCPYSTEQCNPQMVEWAKENRKFLVLTRELIIWRVAP
jgi:ParB-like chromosome segregation protein Spo0J